METPETIEIAIRILLHNFNLDWDFGPRLQLKLKIVFQLQLLENTGSVCRGFLFLFSLKYKSAEPDTHGSAREEGFFKRSKLTTTICEKFVSVLFQASFLVLPID